MPQQRHMGRPFASLLPIVPCIQVCNGDDHEHSADDLPHSLHLRSLISTQKRQLKTIVSSSLLRLDLIYSIDLNCSNIYTVYIYKPETDATIIMVDIIKYYMEIYFIHYFRLTCKLNFKKTFFFLKKTIY